MKNLKKKKFDYFNFLYASGACIVLLGAIAKFLEFDYSDEIFVTGLVVEIIVFAFSSISFADADEEKVNYKWENVFPELLTEDFSEFSKLRDSVDNSAYKELMYQKQVIEEKVREMQSEMEALNRVFSDLSSSTEKANAYMVKMNIANDGYETHMKNLKQNMATMNSFFEAFNKALSSIS